LSIRKAAGGVFLVTDSGGLIQFATNGNTTAERRMTIDATGNVGIGTSSPTTKLQIGDISATDATFQGRIKLEDTSASLQAVGGLEYVTSSFGAGYGWKINSIDSSGVHLAFGTRQSSATWTEMMRIDATGSVGIGTTTPEYRLQVVGGYTGIGAFNTPTLAPSSNSGGAVFSWNRSVGGAETSITNPYNSATLSFEFLQKTGASTANILYQMASTSHIFYISNTEKMRINSSGNVGIGTSTGTYQLQVTGTGQETANLTDAGLKGASLYLQATAVAGGSGGAVLFGTTFSNQTPFAAIKGFVTNGTTNTIGSLRFSTRDAIADTALTERMIIDSSGDAVFAAVYAPTSTLSIGYRGIPQAASVTTNRTLVLTDAGQHVYLTGSTASQSVTIPANSSVAFPIGTTVSIVCDSTVNWSVAITTDTLQLAGGTTTGTRTLTPGAVATCVKVTATKWFISGAGVS